MEIISDRERILLDPFTGVGLSPQHRSSDVDFHDVFGGPPRRSSIYESRLNRADSIGRGREDSAEFHRSRLGSGEKPVFGDGGGSGRRRQLGDDFYSDIFHSSDSACSSPRRGDRDALQSSPGSRVNSPNRFTPIRWDALFGESSLPQSSLSEKMDKDLNHPAFGSQTQHSAYRNEDDRSDTFSHASYRQSPLSRRIPSTFEGLADTMEPAFQTVESKTGKNSSSLDDYIRNQQFHFSIYKWAGKGVMLVMPSDSNKRNEFEGLTRLPEIIVQDSNFDYFSPVTKGFESGNVTQEKKLDKKEDDYIATTANGFSHTESGPELPKYDINKTSDKCGKQSENVSSPGFDENSNIDCVNEKFNPKLMFNAHGEQNHGLKSLSQLFDDDTNKLRGDDIPRKVKERESQSKSQNKQQLQRADRLFSGKVNCTTLHDTPAFLEDKTRGNRVKGKVKDFIKKFNQEGSPKRKVISEIFIRRSKGEDKIDELAHVSSIGADKLQGKTMNNNIPSYDIPKVMGNQVMKKAREEDKSSISCDSRPSEEKIDVLAPQFEPTSEVPDNAACHEENILEDFEAYLVQQLSTNLTEAEQNSPQQDQTKNLDAKIRQWSRGKEGNIRSLLSTLQLVLWAESGWKQVPLVNIIEGASVKKAYQRALLCLHPDKLQQKGASSSQKYIAEKVFDILQEAWDHFNSISEL